MAAAVGSTPIGARRANQVVNKRASSQNAWRFLYAPFCCELARGIWNKEANRSLSKGKKRQINDAPKQRDILCKQPGLCTIFFLALWQMFLYNKL